MKNKEIKEERLKPISLYPLKPEEALSLFIQVDIGEKMTATSKPCKICHMIKSLIEFGKDSQLKSGISNRCKACDKEKNSKRIIKRKGFNWKDFKSLSSTLEDEFNGLYGNSDIRVKGKLVMSKGNVLDEDWYKKKLNKLRKGRKG